MTWRTVTVGQLGRVVTGKTPSSKKPELFGARGDYPFFTPSDLHEGDRTPMTARFISEAGRQAMERTILPTGSTGFTCIASLGKMVLVREPSFTNQQINSVVVHTEKFDPTFVFYLLKMLVPVVKAQAGGVATPILNKRNFSALQVRVPGRATQGRIAEVLSAYDDLIENNNRRMALLEEATHLLYREWFVYLRFPGHDRVEVVDGVPEGWSRTHLVDYLDFKSGKPISKTQRDRGGPIPVYGANGIIGWVPANDAIHTPLAVMGKIGSCGALHRPTGACWVTNNGYAVSCPEDQDVSPGFAWALLEATDFRALVGGAANPYLPVKNFKHLTFLLPPKPLLRDFERVASDFWRQQVTLQALNQRLREARDLLLPRLMNGSIAV